MPSRGEEEAGKQGLGIDNMFQSTSTIHGEIGQKKEEAFGPICGRFWIHLGFSLKKGRREEREGDSPSGAPTYMALRGAKDTKKGMTRESSNLSRHSCETGWIKTKEAKEIKDPNERGQYIKQETQDSATVTFSMTVKRGSRNPASGWRHSLCLVNGTLPLLFLARLRHDTDCFSVSGC